MKGLWYKYSFLPTDNSELVSDFVMVISNKGSDERTVTAKARLRYEFISLLFVLYVPADNLKATCPLIIPF